MLKLNMLYLGTAYEGDRREVSKVSQTGIVDFLYSCL